MIGGLRSRGRQLAYKLGRPVRSARCLLNLLNNKFHPDKLAVNAEASDRTLEFVRKTDCSEIAEIGIYEGLTSLGFAEHLNHSGTLHLFDYEDRVTMVSNKIRAAGYTNVVEHPNSYKLMDSYNWSLMRLIKENEEPIWDYVFLDGAHVWCLDALSFFLIDRLLKVGGYIDFDDYYWSLSVSPGLNPDAFPLTKRMYTDEQINVQQIKLVVDLLVKRSRHYKEVMENKIFQKLSSSH